MLTSIGIYYSTITRTSEIVITFCCALYNGARRRELITVERERESIRKHIDSSRLDAMDRKYVRRIDARTKLIEMEQNVIG